MAGRPNFQNRVLARQQSARTRQEASDKVPLDQRIKRATPGSKEYTRLVAKSQK